MHVLSQLFHSHVSSVVQWWSTYGAFIVVFLAIVAIAFAALLLSRLLTRSWFVASLVALALVVWGTFGNPIETIWLNSPAPSERVNAHGGE
jgi:hypothetical protein